MRSDAELERLRQLHALVAADGALADALQHGRPGAVEDALAYLERDRWGFRTGYVKQRMFTYLRRYELTDRQQLRLEAVLVAAVGVGPRWEFREACRCARRFQTPRLRDAVRSRLAADDPGTAVRAMRMLSCLRHPRLTEDELALGRAALLAWADDPRITWVSNGVETLVRRLMTPEWGDELERIALDASNADRSRAARALLRSVRTTPW